MTTVEFSGLIFLSSLAAGLLGALTGLGGGVVIVPVLTLLFHVDIRYAIGASLVSVIATSSGAAAAYVREGYSNVRIGMFLEIATTLGAVLGAWLTTRVPTNTIGFIFALVLLYSAVASWRKKESRRAELRPNKLAERLRLCGSFPVANGKEDYVAQRVPAGFGLMFSAGTLSGLLGIGSGAVKVLAMDQAMGLPFKVSTTTSNFMIGVTAAASAGIYLSRGYIAPELAMPVMLGVLAGSLMGAKILVHARVNTLRLLFALVIVALGVEMLLNSIAGEALMRLTDEKLDIAIGRTLQGGVLLAAVIVLAGGVMYLLGISGPRPDYSHFHGVPERLRTPSGIWHGIMRGGSESVIQLGLLVLIATPVVRVILAGVGFLMERDRLYFWVSAIVLAVLCYSLWHIR